MDPELLPDYDIDPVAVLLKRRSRAAAGRAQHEAGVLAKEAQRKLNDEQKTKHVPTVVARILERTGLLGDLLVTADGQELRRAKLIPVDTSRDGEALHPLHLEEAPLWDVTWTTKAPEPTLIATIYMDVRDRSLYYSDYTPGAPLVAKPLKESTLQELPYSALRELARHLNELGSELGKEIIED